MGTDLPEQAEIPDIPLNESCVITGPPGTGKPIIALLRARTLHNTGVPVELLGFSRIEMESYESAFKALELDNARAFTHYTWMHHFFDEFFQQQPPIDGSNFDYDDILARFFRRLPEANDGRALIINDGQDLDSSFYLMVSFLINQLGMNIAIFADENQTITRNNSTIAQILLNTGIQKHIILTKNYSNTRPIAELAAACYTGDPRGMPDLPDRVGDKPGLVNTKSLKEAAEIICRWAENPSHESDTAGVFLFTTRTLTRLETAIRKLKPINSGNPVKIQKANRGMRRDDPNRIDWRAPGIKLLQYQGNKGTEFDAVFMPELQGIYGPMANPSLKETKQRFYVAISRARTELTLMYSGEGEPDLLALFPKDLIDEDDDLAILP